MRRSNAKLQTQRSRSNLLNRPATPGAARDMSRSLLAVLALLVAMGSFQTGASLAKQLFPLIGPVGTTTLRLVFGALILCTICRPWRGEIAPAAPRNPAISSGVEGGRKP